MRSAIEFIDMDREELNQLVERARDRDLVRDREIDALGLRPVAQRGIIEIDAIGHGRSPRPFGNWPSV